MTNRDTKGVNLDVEIAASIGWYDTLYIKTDDASTARDLTGETVTIVLKDDRPAASQYGGEAGYVNSYSLTISDAANGVAKIAVPPSAFTRKEGGRLSYECWITTASGENVGLMWGFIDVQERG